MAKLIPVFTLALPITKLYDFNGTPVGKTKINTLYAAMSDHAELGKKLYKGEMSPEKVAAAIKMYKPPTNPAKAATTTPHTKPAVTKPVVTTPKPKAK